MVTRSRELLPVFAILAGMLAGCSSGGSGSNNAAPNTPQQPQNPMAGGDTFAITSSNRLLSFNRNSPAAASAVTVTGLQGGENLIGIDLRPGGTPAGQLYAIGSLGGVYTIDPNSGVASLRTTLKADQTDSTNRFTALDGTRVSMDFNNLVDRLRVVSNTGQNLRINVDTGDTITDDPLTVGGIGSVGVTEVAYTNNFATTCRTTVFYLDTTTDRLLTSANASAGILTSVGSLRVDAAAMSGFDIASTADGVSTAFAILRVNNASSLYTIDLTSGAATAIGSIGQLNANESVLGLATPMPVSTPAQPLGELIALTEMGRIVSFNSSFPQKLCTSASVNGLQGGESMLGIDMRPSDGNVYGLTNGARLYTINPMTGTATFKSALRAAQSDMSQPFQALDGTNFTIDVSPVADGLRVLSDTGMNLRVVMETGDTITDTQLNPTGSTITGAAYTNSFAGTGTTTLYVFDTANDRLMIQGRPSGSPMNGDLQAVGSLGLQGNVQAMIGFDINAINNNAFAALNLAGALTSDLYSINLSTGAATRIGPVGVSERIRGLTYSIAPRATVLGVTSDARLVSFKPGTPGMFDSNVAISGLQGGEQILGFDIRPSNGVAYLLTDGGRVYTLDPATATARLGSSVMPNMNDPFRMLIGTSFGVDFSPTADALRVISDAEHNLAVVVESGATITARSLTRAPASAGLPAPDVIAIAYTNNYFPTADTTLYDVDITTNNLLSQKPANDGILTTIGPLHPTLRFMFSGGFDIVGGQDGLAIAALQPTGAMQSSLYSVNLQTGALTPVGPIGPVGTSRLVGLTIQLR